MTGLDTPVSTFLPGKIWVYHVNTPLDIEIVYRSTFQYLFFKIVQNWYNHRKLLMSTVFFLIRHLFIWQIERSDYKLRWSIVDCDKTINKKYSARDSSIKHFLSDSNKKAWPQYNRNSIVFTSNNNILMIQAYKREWNSLYWFYWKNRKVGNVAWRTRWYWRWKN